MNTKHTDTQLKQALAKMLSEKITSHTRYGSPIYIWQGSAEHPDDAQEVLDTELLYLCWLVERALTTNEQRRDYMDSLTTDTQELHQMLWDYTNATWQQRVTALCKVKGIEI